MVINKKKGDKVHLYAFTGMYLGEYEITASDKKTVSITKANGDVVSYDRKTGKQLDAANERYANSISDEKRPGTKDAKTKKKGEAPAAKKTAKKPAKAAAKKSKPEPEYEDEDEDEDDDDEYEEA